MLSAAALVFRDGHFSLRLSGVILLIEPVYSVAGCLLTFLACSGCPQMTIPRKLVLNLSQEFILVPRMLLGRKSP